MALGDLTNSLEGSSHCLLFRFSLFAFIYLRIYLLHLPFLLHLLALSLAPSLYLSQSLFFSSSYLPFSRIHAALSFREKAAQLQSKDQSERLQCNQQHI